MTPYLQDADVTLYHGDVLDVLREMEAESVDCVVTSPPYWGLRDYGTPGQLGLEPTPEQYVERMVEVFRGVRRVLAAHGTVWLNLGSSYYSDTAKGGSGPGGKNEARWSYGRAARRDAQRSDTSCTEPPGSTAPGCAYPDLCDECAAALSIRTVDSDQPHAESARPPSLTDRGSERSGSEPELLAASPLDAQESTTPQSDGLPPGLCSHCSNCGACLDVLRSSSRDARLCARREGRTSDTSSLALDDHTKGKGAEGMAWLNYTSRLKPKDMVPIPWMVAMALQQDGWFLRADIIWAKPNPMPESVTDRPTKAHEYVFLLSKQPRYFFDAEAVREPHKEPWRGNGEVERGSWDSAREDARRVGKARRADGEEWIRQYNPAGRNIRSVWEIATQPYPEAHFATFPEELARRCIAAGCPEQVCRVCGKARERVVESFRHDGFGHAVTTQYGDEGRHRDAALGPKGSAKQHRTDRETLGLTNCDCGKDASFHGLVMEAVTMSDETRAEIERGERMQPKYRPGIVLDPFMGSGTVAHVARKLGRRSVGIDLSAEYLVLAAKRLQQQSLFAEATSGI